MIVIMEVAIAFPMNMKQSWKSRRRIRLFWIRSVAEWRQDSILVKPLPTRCFCATLGEFGTMPRLAITHRFCKIFALYTLNAEMWIRFVECSVTLRARVLNDLRELWQSARRIPGKSALQLLPALWMVVRDTNNWHATEQSTSAFLLCRQIRANMPLIDQHGASLVRPSR